MGPYAGFSHGWTTRGWPILESRGTLSGRQRLRFCPFATSPACWSMKTGICKFQVCLRMFQAQDSVCPSKPRPIGTLEAPSRSAPPLLCAQPAAALGPLQPWNLANASTRSCGNALDKPTHMTPKAKARCRPALTTFLALSTAAQRVQSRRPGLRCKHLAWCGGASEFHPKVADAAFEVASEGFDVWLGGAVTCDYHCLPPPGVSNEGSIPSSSRAVKKDSAMRARETAARNERCHILRRVR